MKKIAVIVTMFVIWIQFVDSYAQTKTHGNSNYITAAQLRDYLYFIASDEMEGRDTPSRGLNTAAKFIATNLSRWGVKPAGDEGTYFQRIGLQCNKIDPAPTSAEIDGQRFFFGADFLAGPTAGAASGPLVYVGQGWVIKAKNINAYEGIDVKDKIVIALGGWPKSVSFADFKGKLGEDWENPQSYAEKHGAKGIITIPNFYTLADWERQRCRREISEAKRRCHTVPHGLVEDAGDAVSGRKRERGDDF